jgi:hypothetical protein
MTGLEMVRARNRIVKREKGKEDERKEDDLDSSQALGLWTGRWWQH